MFWNIINVFTDIFDQFNTFLIIESILWMNNIVIKKES